MLPMHPMRCPLQTMGRMVTMTPPPCTGQRTVVHCTVERPHPVDPTRAQLVPMAWCMGARTPAPTLVLL
jgi:hypothetical protein